MTEPIREGYYWARQKMTVAGRLFPPEVVRVDEIDPFSVWSSYGRDEPLELEDYEFICRVEEPDGQRP